MTLKKVINNEFDYFNIVPTVDAVSYLVKYCDQMYKNFLKLIDEDVEKNKQFKFQYKEFRYKKYYDNFIVRISDRSYKSIECKDFEHFVQASKDGMVNNVSKLTINLHMSFYRGKQDNLETFENSFLISFSPYDTKFVRKSNYDDFNMNQLEKQINAILKQFPIIDCIFCGRGD